MNMRNRILILILAAQIVLLVAVFWPRARSANQPGQALFPALQADQVVKLTITGADGKSVQLAKSGDAWVVPAADDYPVQADKVPPLLTKIAGLKADRPVATTNASLKRLKVAPSDYEKLVEFQLADGTQHQLFLGTAPNYSATHVRADNQAAAYLAGNFQATDWGSDAASWVDRTYLTIKENDVTGLVLVNQQGRFEFTLSGSTWSLAGLAAGETLDQQAVQGLLDGVSALSLLRPLGKQDKPEYGLATPGAVLTVTTKGDAGEKTLTLKVGAQDPTDKSYAVSSSESAYLVRVSEYAVKNLLTKDRAGFLVQPTATPVPTP